MEMAMLKYIKMFGGLAFVLWTCMMVSCTVDNDDYASNINYNDGPSDTYVSSGLLIGDIDAVVSGDTTRYSEIQTNMGQETMVISAFPMREILSFFPGAVMVDDKPDLKIGYVRDPMPADFDVSTDVLNIQINPDVLEFEILLNGEKHLAAAWFSETTGTVTYGQIIHWKYSFSLRLSELWLDGKPLDGYDKMPDREKPEFIYNAWIMTYGVF